MKVRITLEIDCSIDHLWTFFEDLENLKLWVPGLLEMKITSPEPHGSGSTYIMRMQEGSKVNEYEGRNIIWEPRRRILETLHGGRLGAGHLRADHRFTDLGGRTRFEYDHVYVTKGFWMKLLDPLFYLSSRMYCLRMFNRLKQQAEA